MSNKTYDLIKYIALVVLPAVTIFVGVVLETLNVPYSGIVVTIMTAFDTMIGTMVDKASKNYNKEEE